MQELDKVARVARPYAPLGHNVQETTLVDVEKVPARQFKQLLPDLYLPGLH